MASINRPATFDKVNNLGLLYKDQGKLKKAEAMIQQALYEQTLEEHSVPVNAVAFSPDSKTLALVSGDNTIRLWDAATGAHRKTPEGHSNWGRAVACSPDCQYLETSRGLRSINLNPSSNPDVLNMSKDGKPAANGAYFVPSLASS